MNGRLDVHQDGTATVTRDGRKYTFVAYLNVQADDMKDARDQTTKHLDSLLADLVWDEQSTSGPVKDDEGQRIGEWEIFCSEETE